MITDMFLSFHFGLLISKNTFRYYCSITKQWIENTSPNEKGSDRTADLHFCVFLRVNFIMFHWGWTPFDILSVPFHFTPKLSKKKERQNTIQSSFPLLINTGSTTCSSAVLLGTQSWVFGPYALCSSSVVLDRSPYLCHYFTDKTGPFPEVYRLAPTRLELNKAKIIKFFTT